MVFDLLHHGIVEHSTTAQNSPGYADYFEGQRRVAVNSNGTLFGFYYDGSNIVYKRSFDDGHSWSASATSTGTGPIASDSFRWTIAYALHNGTDRIVVLYYTVSGSNTNFYQKTFKVLDSGLEVVSTVNSFSAANDASCSPTGVCAAAAGSFDSNSTFYAAYRWKSGGTWHYKILKSADGGSTWATSIDTTDVTSTSNRFSITLTFLGSNKMLFAYTTYESSNISYRIFNGTAWGSTNVVSAGISTNSVKQISSGTVNIGFRGGEMTAYVAFLANGNQGTLKLAVFSSAGTFRGIETADSTITHWLPSVSITGDGTVHVYSLYNNIIYDTKKKDVTTDNPGFEFINYAEGQPPSAYWKFENDTLDYTGNANNGTLYGNSTFTNESVGLVGRSLDLDGSGDYMRVADSATLDISGNISVSAWVLLDEQTSDFRTIVRKGGAYVLEKNNNNLPRFTIWSGGSSTPVVLGTTTMQVDRWYHIVGTYDGSYLRIYVNGVLEGTTARSGAISTNNNDLYVGSQNSTAQFINAKLDDILIYNRALNQQDIRSAGAGWDLRGGRVNTADVISGQIDLVRSGIGDTRSRSVPASPGKLYTLEADVLVSSGFAKIDLNFLDSSGAWLTNNTLPASGISATSTTGSIQHLSASWVAPANSASMMVRLINNMSGGSAKFDSVRVTTWESPVAPYGTDFYSPDQLTAQIAGPLSTGVLWRSGGASPYEFNYAGELGVVFGQTDYWLSPLAGMAFDGQKRILRTAQAMFAFYYDGSVIKYKYSTDYGATWKPSSGVSTGAGPINGYYYGWTIIGGFSGTKKFVSLLYHERNPSLPWKTLFMTKRGTIDGTAITWGPEYPPVTGANQPGCSQGTCASVTGAVGDLGDMYGAWKYKWSDGKFHAFVARTVSGGDWEDGDVTNDIPLSTSDPRLSMALTKLPSSGKMLFTWIPYDSQTIYYKVLNSGMNIESSGSITTGTELAPYSVRQSSAYTDSSGRAHLAYVTQPGGKLKVATWNVLGQFQGIQTADSTRLHKLPSIANYYDSMAIYSITGGRVWVTIKTYDTWFVPQRPYKDTASTTATNQLTSSIALDNYYFSAAWTEGAGPFTMKVNGIPSPAPFTPFACGGNFLFPHEDGEEPSFRLFDTDTEVKEYLVSIGRHQVQVPWSADPENDYAITVDAYGCRWGKFREQDTIGYNVTALKWTYDISLPEPNPELLSYVWPTWWWGIYVRWWHNTLTK